MKLQCVFVLLFVASAAHAIDRNGMNRLKHLLRSDHGWEAPAKDACRSPCPAINTLANHGYLPRNGKGVTIKQLSDAFQQQLGADETFGGGFAKIAGGKFIKIHNHKLGRTEGEVFDLCDLKTRFDAKPFSGVQHDGSMTRPDGTPVAELGKPNKPFIEAGLKWLMDNKGVKADGDITLEQLSDLRGHLWEQSIKKNPNEPGWTKQKAIGFAETLLLLKVLGGQTGTQDSKISVEYYKSFLMEEKFPASWALKRNGAAGSKKVGLTAFPGAIIKWAGFSLSDSVSEKWTEFKGWASSHLAKAKSWFN